MRLKEILEIHSYLRNNEVENGEVLANFLSKHTFSVHNLSSRKNIDGHLTVSGLILSEDSSSLLLIKNKKFNKWLMPGGHIEKGESLLDAIKREIKEEVGVEELDSISTNISGVDVHKIPENKDKNEKEHWHFDIRFAFRVKNKNVLIDNVEAVDYSWVPINEISDDSILKVLNNINLKKKKKNKLSL